MKHLLAAACAATIATSAAAQDCAKLVFNRYCLGGPEAALAEHKPTYQTETGGKKRYVFGAPGEPVFVSAYEGRIDTITAVHPRATWLRWNDMRTQIVRVYGEGTPAHNLPPHADNPTAIENAIGVGRGRMTERWQQDGWHLTLNWTAKGILLLYTHEATYNAWRAANPNPGGY